MKVSLSEAFLWTLGDVLMELSTVPRSMDWARDLHQADAAEQLGPRALVIWRCENALKNGERAPVSSMFPRVFDERTRVCVSGRDVTYPTVQKVVEFIVWQRVLF